MFLPRPRRSALPPHRYGWEMSFDLDAGTINWKNNPAAPMAAVRLHQNGDGYKSVRTAQPVRAGDILAEFGGEVYDHANPEGRLENWFIKVEGHGGLLVLDGAIRGEWTLERYLNERKIASFVNSSQTVPGTHNYQGANAVLEWIERANPQNMRAVLRARIDIESDVEVLWSYRWVK
jgi:hypothetical protein